MTTFSTKSVGVKRQYPFKVRKKTIDATNISYSQFKSRISNRLASEFPVASSPATTRRQHLYREYDTVRQRLLLDSPPRAASLSCLPSGEHEKLESPLQGVELAVGPGRRDLACCDISALPLSLKFFQCSDWNTTEQGCEWKECSDAKASSSTPQPFTILQTDPSMPCSHFQPELWLAVPGLQDNYYLNLLAWSERSMVALGLGSVVYLWNAETQTLMGSLHLRPHPFSYTFPHSKSIFPSVSSITWSNSGHVLFIGNSDGEIQVWDVERMRSVRKLIGHLSMVGSLSCNQHILSSGSLLGQIHHHDIRVARSMVGCVQQQKAICGLEWSPDGSKLASGTTDGLLCIWPGDPGVTKRSSPLLTISHPTAVKALGWCPWQLELVAVGGGREDGSLRIWDTNTGACLQSAQTDSQICSLSWCSRDRELLSAHGLPHHQVTCWDIASLTKRAELHGHRGRVLHLALSPCGTKMFTAGSDLRACLWKWSGRSQWSGTKTT